MNPTRRELKALSLVLEPGGALYVELRGYVRPRARLAAPSLGAVERRLARLGFVDVRAHWQFPDAAECEEIVPLTSARTIRYALTRKRRTLPARAKGMLARAALAAGAFPTIISSRSVTARLPEARR